MQLSEGNPVRDRAYKVTQTQAPSNIPDIRNDRPGKISILNRTQKYDQHLHSLSCFKCFERKCPPKGNGTIRRCGFIGISLVLEKVCHSGSGLWGFLYAQVTPM